MDRADVVVVGAGLIGSAIALRLAQQGRSVVLLDRGEPGRESSSAAAGLLQPDAGREANPQTLGLWLRSLAQYSQFVDEIRQLTGAALEYRRCGRLVAALDEEQEAALRIRAAHQVAAGIAYEWLAAEDVKRCEPAANPGIWAAIYYPQHGLVDNQTLSRSVPTAAALAGAQVRPFEPALSISYSSARVDGVVTPLGKIAADVVVLAAGCWSSLLAPNGAPSTSDATPTPRLFEYQAPASGGWLAPVRPAKGELVILRLATKPIERVITIPGASISARSDGRIVVGATILDHGFNKELTAAGVAELIAAARSAVPSLDRARYVEGWAGLRPRTPDDQPIVGADRIAGLYWATGHFSMGILSAPATAEVVTALIEGRAPPIPVDSLSPERFCA
ncbi:MAG TPA: FAD-dependent oxidoreductase [Chloroflexota bacterium]|nr:FAD-dependent oxidoreductase [Chloroflexota bacterium]